MKKRLTYKYFRPIRSFLTAKAYYYDDMLCLKEGIDSSCRFDKAEAEHLCNHEHLDCFLNVEDYTKDDFRKIAELRFAYLKLMYPDLPIILYLVWDADDRPIIDFGLVRENEMIYYDLSRPGIEYWESFPHKRSHLNK